VSPNSDPFDLERFVEAQAGVFDVALSELEAGAKRSHWMWFVFPQIAGLGRSRVSRYYAIRSRSEAKAYLEHPLLGPRLRQAAEALMPWAGTRDAAALLGPVDAIKLRSSLTLFAAVAPDEQLFEEALAAFFGAPDSETLRLLS
jgi:uncharacterized protein (DUF1810 family)